MKDEEGEGGVGNVMLKEWEARDVTTQVCMYERSSARYVLNVSNIHIIVLNTNRVTRVHTLYVVRHHVLCETPRINLPVKPTTLPRKVKKKPHTHKHETPNSKLHHLRRQNMQIFPPLFSLTLPRRRTRAARIRLQPCFFS